MQKDITGKRLEEYNDVFVDIFNNLLFEGRHVLSEDTLIPMPTESYSRRPSGAYRQGNRDIRKADVRKGAYRLICGSENQQDRDHTMPLRVMGYDFSAYEEQVRLYMAENKKKETPAYTKRIHADQKLAPVVTAVLYWGTEEWDSPRCLHDMLRFPEEYAEQIYPYVANYPMNLISVAKLKKEERERLTSDFRLIAEYVANREDPKLLREVMQRETQKIRHPEEFLDALGEVAGNKRIREVKEILFRKEEREDITMYTVFDLCVDEGREEGIKEGRIEGRIEQLFSLLQDLGPLSDRLCERIRREKNVNTLKEWTRQAVRAESMEEFIRQMTEKDQ